MYNNDSDSLNAGAPDIRLTGNQQMASYGYDDAMAESRQAYEQGLKDGTVPFDMEFEEFLELMQDSKRAPQPNSGIMASAPGTYTQRRRAQMAGGGIMGSNNGSMLVAPTADGSRPGYAWYDFIVDPVKDFVTEKALPFVVDKAPDFLSDLLGGGKDQPQPRPDYGPYSTTPPYVPEMQQDPWYKKLAQTIVPGGETGYYDLYSTGAQASESTGTPPYFPSGGTYKGGGADFFEMLGGGGGGGGSQFDDGFRKALATILPGGDPGYVEGGLYNSLLGGGIPSALSPYLGEGEGRRVNPLYPIGIGAGVGKYVSGLPKDKIQGFGGKGMDLASIRGPAQESQAAAKAAGLYFTPEDETRLPSAQGGRIGYANGTPNVPEEFLEDLKRRDFDKLLNDYRRFKELQERRKDFGPGGQEVAQGGRIGAQEGGLMNLGGMEKDYRNDGGFVPIGGKEKADDVPARLSKNEFVFTADAVRNAGGGDIDKGAEIMENLMKSLESGGEVSEDSQGLEGARGMFANAQELQKRIV